MVPLIWGGDSPCDSATVMYNARSVEAVELIVIEVLTLSNGILAKLLIISSIELIVTPVRPTSPSASR